MTTATVSPRWFKSSYSNNGGACVEVAVNLGVSHGVVPVGDSKTPAGPIVDVSTSAFSRSSRRPRAGTVGAPGMLRRRLRRANRTTPWRSPVRSRTSRSRPNLRGCAGS
ncbi:DUF397 domain-containing protein [Streptomyces sp. NPDC091292]|uniref:DUF397 domain-containing protein n=1 Tax=Streptomyces sp. NPDC091292 TaxID=3365991 RepID=UPI00382E4DE4